MDMNNEMDELFRKAGEDYPLNLGKPDWDAVAGKLHTDTGDLGPGFGMVTAAPRKRRRYQWLLLLLLPLGLYGVMELARGRTRPADGSQQTADGTRSADGTRAEKAPAGNNTTQPTKKSAGDAENQELNEAGNKEKQKETPSSGSTGKNASDLTVTGRATGDRNDAAMVSGKTHNQRKNLSAKKHPEMAGSGSAGAGNAGNNNAGAGRYTAEKAASGISGQSSAATAEVVAGDSSSGLGNEESKDAAPGSPSLADQVMAGMVANSTNQDSSSAGTGSNPKKDEKTAEKKGKKSLVHPSVKKDHGFYAGITAAPDFSTVKFQSMKSTGYSFGVVGGYRISSHFSVETGFSWDRKKYYSKGEYFNKSKTQIPPSVKVNYIDGYCDMFEIPLTVRYDLTTGKKGHWFAAAGFSSYLMKSENYLYGATANNVSWSRYVDYKNSGNNFFSIAQFSLGYEYSLSAHNGIRVEPYFKAPISGVGIGKLPISSVGITFGFIHSFR